MTRTRRPRRLVTAVAAAMVGAWTASITAGPILMQPLTAHASGPTLLGWGSTWVQIALDQWRADIARQGYTINYQGTGSSSGRNAYIIGQVDFAASEIPFQPQEIVQLQAEHKSYQYLPDVAGGTSLMYNLHTPAGARITSLRLDSVTAARIFTGGLTSWQDPQIRALNPALTISETTVVPVIRSDGSGTSAQFSLYLQAQAASVWSAFVAANGCPAPCSLWPTFAGSTQQAGSDGVANFVASDQIGTGSIGYVEAGYAFGRAFPVASLRNASGNFAQPSAANVATALTHAVLNADLTQNLVGVYAAPEANVYPMSSYSYMITQTTGFDPAKGFVLGTWIIYIACAGQREAQPLGYSPLPPNLVRADFAAVARIPGAPTPPPVDAQHCPNPTVPPAAGGPTPPSSSASAAAAASRAAASAAANRTGGPAAAGSVAAAGATPTSSTSVGGVAGVTSGDGTGGANGSSTGPRVPTLSDAQRLTAFGLAEQRTAGGLALPVMPLFAAALAVVLFVFAPLLLDRRRPTWIRPAWLRPARLGRLRGGVPPPREVDADAP